MKTSSTAAAGKNGEKKRFSEKLDTFLRTNRVLLFIIFGVILAAVAVVAVYSIVDNNRATSSALKVEQLAENLSTWSTTEDKAKKAELGASLTAGLQEVAKDYPRQFAGARALTMLARMAEADKDWTGAEKLWMDVYTRFPKIYLAPIALQNAAVAAEERGAMDQAATYYKLVVDKFNGKSVGIAHAMFSLGRLAENNKDYVQALSWYEKIIAAYPDDDWTKLAKDRIIFLKAQGSGK